MFRAGGHFNPDGSFDFHGSWSGIGSPSAPSCSDSRPQLRPVIVGASSKGLMKGRAISIEMILEKPVLVTGLSIPSSLAGVLIEQIRVDDVHDLILPTGHFEGVKRAGVPYAAIHHAQQQHGGVLGRTVAKNKVTIVVRRCPVVWYWRLEVRLSRFARKAKRGSGPRTKFVERRGPDGVPSRKSRFFAALECMVLEDGRIR